MIGIFALLSIAMLMVIKFCKRTVKTILSVIIILITIYCVIVSIDMNRVYSLKEPIFIISKEQVSLYETKYKGLGYEIKIVKDEKDGKMSQISMYIFNRFVAGAIE